jgi:phosphopantothenoylcysteine synthetase/decarboxylase
MPFGIGITLLTQARHFSTMKRSTSSPPPTEFSATGKVYKAATDENPSPSPNTACSVRLETVGKLCKELCPGLIITMGYLVEEDGQSWTLSNKVLANQTSKVSEASVSSTTITVSGSTTREPVEKNNNTHLIKTEGVAQPEEMVADSMDDMGMEVETTTTTKKMNEKDEDETEEDEKDETDENAEDEEDEKDETDENAEDEEDEKDETDENAEDEEDEKDETDENAEDGKDVEGYDNLWLAVL